MSQEVSKNFWIVDEVYEALNQRLPVVALESTVITHGLPYPENRLLAIQMEEQVRNEGGIPATIAILDGKIKIGLELADIERLAIGENMRKITNRDLAVAQALGFSGGTTVAATILAAYLSGIRVFATGGIGGVHRPSGQLITDISADLPQLASTPVIVICAGAKSILDIPNTLEYLETWGVPLLGYQTDEFPAFFSRRSGLKPQIRVNSPVEVIQIAKAHWGLGLRSAVLVANPPPEEYALEPSDIDAAISSALTDAEKLGIRGQDVSPFLLQRVSELTDRSSLKVNLALLLNNARLATKIASTFNSVSD